MYEERRSSTAKSWNDRLIPFRNFFRQTDLHGFKYLAEPNRILLERVIWSVILLGFMLGSMYTIASSLTTFLEAPTAISEVPTKRKVDEIPFPAVTVCMANRFSRRRVMGFAEFVFQNQNGSSFSAGDSVEAVYESLKTMVHLIDFSAPKDDTDVFRLHSILTYVYKGHYPINEILTNLQVPCEDILIFCAWLDMPVNCSEVFQSRRTSSGQCCIFNYVRPRTEEFNDALNKKVGVNVSEPLNASTEKAVRFKGLSIVIDYTPEDDVVTLTNTFDTMIQIHNNRDYPDPTNGALRQAFVSMGTQTYIQLYPKYVRASPELRSVRYDIRNCVFEDEIQLVFKDYYTFGEGILVCRLSDMIRMCGCTPPSMVVIHNATYCDLADLSCLIRFQEKWINSDINLYDFTIQNTYCVSSYPTCNYLRYELQTTNTVIREISRINIATCYGSRQSVVHIYYGDNYVKEFEQSMISTWYDLLSSLGGIIALITGGSLITIFEVSYLLTGRFGATYIRKLIRRCTLHRQRRVSHQRDSIDSSFSFNHLKKSSIPSQN